MGLEAVGECEAAFFCVMSFPLCRFLKACSALLCSGASHLSHFRMCDCGGLASPGWFPFPSHTLLPSLRPLLLSPDLHSSLWWRQPPQRVGSLG